MKKYDVIILFISLALFMGSANSTDDLADEPSTGSMFNEVGETAAQTGNQDGDDTGTREPFLRLTGQLRNQSVVSGEKAQFRCRVESWPDDRMTYTWYKDNRVFIPNENDYRITIQNKPTGSRLRIRDTLTTDNGLYRCEASNGVRRVHTSAYLTVSFSRPPVNPSHVTKVPQGKCETYSGNACKDQLGGMSVYIDPFLTQQQMEGQITTALDHITKTEYVTANCKRYAFPAFCNFVFPLCEYTEDLRTGKTKASPIKLCREDCELMKYDVCGREFMTSRNDDFLQAIFMTANCSELPATTSRSAECTKVGLPSVSNKLHKCYNDSGTSYRGTASVTETGVICKAWPKNMVVQYPELAGGHNFCRNPGNKMDAPWCYISNDNERKEICDLDKCASPPAGGTDMIVILIPSVAIPFIIGCIAVAFCVCRKRNSRNAEKKNGNVKSTKGKMIDMSVITMRKSKLPELSASSVHLMVEIGDGQYGKVYKAKVLANPQFSTNFPVAVKTLRDSSLSPQVEDFQREVDVFSELQHENVACLKAVVVQPTMRCMIFEYTNSVDLHEYLVLHSPQADFAKPPSSASSHASSTIDHADFTRMSIQVASGMEYLSSNNFIHRDLSARNVLVCGNMDLKICNLGVVRDSYLSSYYRSPQGGQMLPIRWMAPESLQCWKFSDKSTIWSFGVLLWEMFSYGLQPYCGYSNHEVLEMISRRQLLTCPDQCPAKMYSLMHECWAGQPNQRPQFSDLRAKLQGWEGSSTGRVTSQLAQGIHRQLTNVMREGTGPYNQYAPPSSIGGSSGITYSSTIPGPTPSPPPQYVGGFPLPSSSASTFMTSQPIPPNVSPSSQQFFSSPGTTGSYPTSAGLYQPGYQSGQQSAYPYNGNYQGNQQTKHQLYQNDLLHQQQRRPQPYRKGPASQSSRSSSSCASSSRDQYAPIQPLRQVNGDDVFQDGFVHQQPPFSGPGNRPLSGVMEDEDDEEDEQYYQQTRQMISGPNPPLIVTTNPPANQAPVNVSKLASPPMGHQHEADSSDMSTTSVKATSCDSGLPIDDVDSHGMDQKTPLMGRPPRIPNKTPVRGSTPRKFT